MQIVFTLIKNDEVIIRLTEKSIDKINFIYKKHSQKMSIKNHKDIELFISTENFCVDEFDVQVNNSDGKYPTEIDSFRDLLNFALISCTENKCYLNATVNVNNNIFDYDTTLEYKNCFVIHFEEKFDEISRNTQIYLYLRSRHC